MTGKQSTSSSLFALLTLSTAALVAVWLGTAAAYWSGTVAANSPLTTASLIVAGLLALAAIASYPFERAVFRAVGTLLYVAAFGTAAFFTGLITACSFGDCL